MKSVLNNAFLGNSTEKVLRELGCEFTRKPDGTFYVAGDINLSDRGLTRLPDLSSVEVGGNFYCSINSLTSLEGAPKAVGGSFHCDYNNLKNLKGAPQRIGKSFFCNNNKLTSLAGAPETVAGDFFCDENHLTSLEGGPKSVTGSFYCSENALSSLKGGPATVGGGYFCNNNNLSSLIGAPAAVGENFSCSQNALRYLEGAPASFKKLLSDFGEFSSWDKVPERLRVSPETKSRLQREWEQQVRQTAEQMKKLPHPVKAPPRPRFKKRA